MLVNTTIYEFGECDSKSSDLEVTVTNRSSLEIFVHACWVGYSLRRWKSPWRRETIDAFSATEIDNEGLITGKSAGYFELPPGKRADIHVPRSDLQNLRRPSLMEGFLVKKCIEIEHSASQQSVFLFVI